MSKKKIDKVIDIWSAIREETRKRAEAEPVLASFFHSTILEYSSFSSAIANQLANDLSNISVQPLMLRNVIKETIDSNQQIIKDISLEVCETGIKESVKMMEDAIKNGATLEDFLPKKEVKA